MKNIFLVYAVFSTLISTWSFAQTSLSQANYSQRQLDSLLDSKISIAIRKIDSLNESYQHSVIDYNYLLERTNGQLYNSYSPLSLAIGILTALFAIMAIITSAIIFLQSRDFRSRLDDFLNKYRITFEELIKDASGAISGFDVKITDAEVRYSTATEEQKKQITKELAELKSQRDSLSLSLASKVTSVPLFTAGSFGTSGYSGYSGPAGPSGYSRFNSVHHKCSQCGFGFEYQPLHSAAYSGSSRPNCPKCGNVD